MRISKLCLVVCAGALCAASPTVRADDNPAQAAARAALEEQMRALDMQSAPTNAPVPAPVTPAQPAQPAVQAPAQPAVTTPPPVSHPPAMETNQSAAPAATVPTTNVPQAQPPTNPPPATSPAMTPAPRVAPAQTTKPATSSASSSGNSLFSPVPPPSGGTSVGAMPEETTPSAPTSVAPTAVQIPSPAPVQSPPMEPSPNNNGTTTSATALGLKPIVAPPLPISATQQAQLQALLQKYDAGAITPMQYQAERARILNEPH